jgi:hypothetical protein
VTKTSFALWLTFASLVSPVAFGACEEQLVSSMSPYPTQTIMSRVLPEKAGYELRWARVDGKDALIAANVGSGQVSVIDPLSESGEILTKYSVPNIAPASQISVFTTAQGQVIVANNFVGSATVEITYPNAVIAKLKFQSEVKSIAVQEIGGTEFFAFGTMSGVELYRRESVGLARVGLVGEAVPTRGLQLLGKDSDLYVLSLGQDHKVMISKVDAATNEIKVLSTTTNLSGKISGAFTQDGDLVYAAVDNMYRHQSSLSFYSLNRRAASRAISFPTTIGFGTWVQLPGGTTAFAVTHSHDEKSSRISVFNGSDFSRMETLEVEGRTISQFSGYVQEDRGYFVYAENNTAVRIKNHIEQAVLDLRGQGLSIRDITEPHRLVDGRLAIGVAISSRKGTRVQAITLGH